MWSVVIGALASAGVFMLRKPKENDPRKDRMARALAVRVGLSVALFLFISGLTGAVISWDHELDAWLNPQLFHAASGTEHAHARTGLELTLGLIADRSRTPQ